MLQELPEFRDAVVARLSDEWEAMTTAGTAQGFDPAMIQQRLTAHAPAYVAKAVAETQEHYGRERMMQEMRLHFRGGS
jgi:hypothetical protein